MLNVEAINNIARAIRTDGGRQGTVEFMMAVVLSNELKIHELNKEGMIDNVDDLFNCYGRILMNRNLVRDYMGRLHDYYRAISTRMSINKDMLNIPLAFRSIYSICNIEDEDVALIRKHYNLDPKGTVSCSMDTRLYINVDFVAQGLREAIHELEPYRKRYETLDEFLGAMDCAVANAMLEFIDRDAVAKDESNPEVCSLAMLETMRPLVSELAEHTSINGSNVLNILQGRLYWLAQVLKSNVDPRSITPHDLAYVKAPVYNYVALSLSQRAAELATSGSMPLADMTPDMEGFLDNVVNALRTTKGVQKYVDKQLGKLEFSKANKVKAVVLANGVCDAGSTAKALSNLTAVIEASETSMKSLVDEARRSKEVVDNVPNGWKSGLFSYVSKGPKDAVRIHTLFSLEAKGKGGKFKNLDYAYVIKAHGLKTKNIGEQDKAYFDAVVKACSDAKAAIDRFDRVFDDVVKYLNDINNSNRQSHLYDLLLNDFIVADNIKRKSLGLMRIALDSINGMS